MCGCVRAPLVPRHSWLGHAVWLCVLGLRFWLRPATPGWAVVVFVWLYPVAPGWGVRCRCVCFLSRFGCARHSWLGCWGLCVFLCALRLYPPTPGSGVRCGCVYLGSGFGCALPLLAGTLERVCVCVRALLLPRRSWLGCLARVCVLGLRSRLRPATPDWGVGVCVCLCARSACTPPLLAGVCGVGACAWAGIAPAPRHSWLGCLAVCVCACVCALLVPLIPGWCGRCGWVCLGSGFGSTPPLLAGLLGCVCVRLRAPLVPRHSWLGCWDLCVFVCALRLYPATPGWGVGICVCSCAHSAATPPLPAGVCGVCVCAPARVSAAPRHSWLGCWGLFVFVCALCLYPATPGWDVGLYLFVCALRLYPATPGCGCGVGVCAWALVSAAPRHS